MIAPLDPPAAPAQSPPDTSGQPKAPDSAAFGAFSVANASFDRFTLDPAPANANAYRDAITSVSANVTPPVAAPVAASVGSNIVDESGAYAHVADGKLPHNATIVERGYQFTTDGQGRVVSAEGNLTVNPKTGAARDAQTKAAQLEVGWQDRLPNDHGGHIIADRFNGPGSFVNLMAQDGNFNLGEYKKLENSWAKSLQSGQTVHVRVDLSYRQGSLRPSEVTAKTTLGSGQSFKSYFHNAPGGKAPATGDSTAGGESRVNVTAEAAQATAADGASVASKLAKGAEIAGKIATPFAVAADAYGLYGAYKEDGGRIGSHTVDQAASVAGGWAGAAAGLDVGAEAGAAVGAAFGGVGAVPGAVIGGAVGAIAGGVIGSDAGKAAVHVAEKAFDAGKKAVQSVANFLGL